MIPSRAYYGLAPTDEILTVPSVNDSPVLQVRITEAGPEHRYLTPEEEEYSDGGSQWTLYTVDEVHRQAAIGTPVVAYLQRHIDWSVTSFAGTAEIAEYRYRRRQVP